MQQDRNFDDLTELFSRRVYQGSKGQIRLAVLKRDLHEIVPALFEGNHQLRVLDAGGGEGVFSRQLAQQGHRVTVCDVSANMLGLSRQGVQGAPYEHHMQWLHSSIQDLPVDELYDVVLCHAVLEWTVNPAEILSALLKQLKPGGRLSVMFFNRHSTVFRCLVRGYLDKALNNQFQGSGKGLTPINPLDPSWVIEWLHSHGLTCQVKSGIRVFHDYMHNDVRLKRDPADILELELRYSREEPYRSLGRYYHVIAEKMENETV